MKQKFMKLFYVLLFCVSAIFFTMHFSGNTETIKAFNSHFAGGDGTEGNPYQITTPEELAAVNFYLGPTHYNKHFVLVNDIDLTSYLSYSGEGWNGGEGWNPIGTQGAYFGGNFNGNGYKISGLRINRSSTDFIGLFGMTGSATIKNIVIEGDLVRGRNEVGILIGYQDGGLVEKVSVNGKVEANSMGGGLIGLIDEGRVFYSHSDADVTCTGVLGNTNRLGGLIAYSSHSDVFYSYATGDVNYGGIPGNGTQEIGGLIGNINSSNVSYSYATGNVVFSGSTTGSVRLGGLVGCMNDLDSISYSYATGEVATTGSTSSKNVGAFLGFMTTGATLSDNFYLSQGMVAGIGNRTNIGLQSKTLTEMKTRSTFVNWDFRSVWFIEENSSFPLHIWKLLPNGKGTIGDPFQISTPKELSHLNIFGGIEGVFFILKNDINLTSYLQPGGEGHNGGKGWIPIGTDVAGSQFLGNFNGDGYTISGLWIDRSGEDNVGLFGCVGKDNSSNIGRVANVKLEGDTKGIFGNNRVGSLVGTLYGTFENVYTRCKVVGNNEVGGLVGYFGTSGLISKAHSESETTGTYNIGGMVGRQFGQISDSYTDGKTMGNYYIGGMAGDQQDGKITRSFTNGSVSGTGQSGGLVGNQTGGIIDSSFFNKDTTASSKGIGNKETELGKSAFEMRQKSTFLVWDFVDVWYLGEGKYPNLLWEHFVGGDGSKANPYRIKSAEGLAILSDLFSKVHQNKHFVLVNDIDLTAYLSPSGEGYNGGKGWKPIGRYVTDSNEYAFYGKFDGNGHTVRGLSINRDSEDGIGFFGCVGFGGSVNNLSLYDVNVRGGSYIGGIVGFLCGGEIKNSTVDGELFGFTSLNGLVGFRDSGNVDDCIFYGTLTFLYHVGFDANGGTGAPSDQIKVQGEDLELSSSIPTREGHIFLGWNTDKEAKEACFSPTDTFSIDSNTTLYAVWERKIYTLSYDANGGYGEPTETEFAHGDAVVVSEDVPTREGHIFLGWNTDKEATVALYGSGESRRFLGNTTLYAIWSKNVNSDENINPTETTGPDELDEEPGENLNQNETSKPILKAKEKPPSTIVLKWSKVNQAKRFELYRKGGKNKKFVLVKSFNKNQTSFTDKKAVKGYTYSYKLTACVEGGDGVTKVESSVTKITLTGKPVTPKITKAIKKGNILTLFWNGSAGAKNLELYIRNGSKGKFKRLMNGKVKNYKKRIRLRINVRNGNYSFRMRTFTIVRGKKVYSPYSKARWVKV